MTEVFAPLRGEILNIYKYFSSETFTIVFTSRFHSDVTEFCVSCAA